MRARTLVLLFAISASAFATTIPPDLEAHAAELRKHASPQLLAWAHDQGVALARAHGPVDLGALEQTIRSQFVAKPVPAAKSGAASKTAGSVTYPNLGNLGNEDVMAIAFIVMMEASKSAQEDLKGIMDGVKAINKQKDGLRTTENEINKLSASMASNPTPAPDRVSELVAAARNIQGRTLGANLLTLAHR